MSIRVLVINDEPLARLGITTRLGAYSDMLMVGEIRYRRGGAHLDSIGRP